MIVVITAWPGALECVAELARATGERVQLLELDDLLESDIALADVVVMDELLLGNPRLEEFTQRARAATPVFINFAICGRERLIREVQMAVQRRQHDQLMAMEAAQATLRNEIKGDITGIMLAAQLALENLELPSDAREKLQQISGLASDLKWRLAPNAAPRRALQAAAGPTA
jgi:nitrogen-specific signal transduction histidine kinase